VNFGESPVAQFILFIILAGLVALGVILYRLRAQLSLLLRNLSLYFVPVESAPHKVLRPLFVVSFAGLFIEVMLIRWVGTEVRIFAYFQNLALIACFLGFGLGCYWSGRRKNLLFSLLAMTALVALVEAPFAGWKEFLRILSSLLSLSPDSVFWGYGRNPSGLAYVLLLSLSVAAVAILLLLLVGVMVPIGQWVGFFLDTAPNPVSAYSVNLLGSIAGVWAFAGMAFLWLSPEAWFGLACLLVLVVRRPSRRMVMAGVLLVAGSVGLLLLGRRGPALTYWSPYQKLDLVGWGENRYTIYVNTTGYMSIANLTGPYLARHPEIARTYRTESSYDAPYRFAQGVERVLIVGAGAGNDAAAALRNGAARVDAVEIDPVIYFLGKRFHPERPYQSSQVHVILNDARAYLRQTTEKYDFIEFGLLDSHTQFSDYSNMRIDNYVYTEEAFREARRLLKPQGILVVKFEVRSPWTWMGQRFYAMLAGIFNRPPLVFYLPWCGDLAPATVFITSGDDDLWARARQTGLASILAQHPPSFDLRPGGVPPLTTDDWPYIYQRARSIPRTILSVSLLLLIMAVFMVRGVLEPGRISTWHFFFLGAGFLLLETQMVSRLALYFGTTWMVNCVVLTAVLLMLVAANVYVERRRPPSARQGTKPASERRLGPYYALLLAGLLVNLYIPWHRLPYSAPAVGVMLSLAYAVPVFFAGVIFTESFRAAERKSGAFGANIVGAVAGGVAQNLSFIVGLKMLLVVAAVFYAAAAACDWLLPQQRRVEPGSAATSAAP
jgi:SAM-dependent methyltransferase